MSSSLTIAALLTFATAGPNTQEPSRPEPATTAAPTLQEPAPPATPQQPAEPVATPPPVRTSNKPLLSMAQVLPSNTLVMVACNPLGPHRDALAATGLSKLLLETDAFGPLRTGFLTRWEQLLERSELSAGELEQAVTSGAALAWTGMDDAGSPMLVAVLDLAGTAETVGAKMPQWMAAWQDESQSVEQRAWDGVDVWHVTDGAGAITLATAVSDGLLIVASHEEELIAVIQRQRLAQRGDEDLQSLVTHPSFQGLSAQAQRAGEPVVGAWLRPGLIMQRLTRLAPDGFQGRIQKLIQSTGFDRLLSVGYTLHPTPEGILKERIQLDTAASDTDSLCDTLLGRGTDLSARFQNAIPADAAGFAVTTFNLLQIVEQGLATMEAMDLKTHQQVTALLQSFAAEHGVDLIQDCVAALGHELLTVHWIGDTGRAAAGETTAEDNGAAGQPGDAGAEPSQSAGSFQGGTPGTDRFAIVLPLKNGWSLGNSLTALQQALPIPMQFEDREGFKLITVSLGDLPLGAAMPEGTQAPRSVRLGITANELVVSTDREDVLGILKLLSGEATGHPAGNLLADLAPGTVGIHWRDLNAIYGQSLGPATTVTRWSGDTLTVHSQSSVGNLDGLLQGLWRAQDLMFSPGEMQDAGLVAVADDQEAEVVQAVRLTQLGEALSAWRTTAGPDADGDAVREFAPLETVLVHEDFDAGLLGFGFGAGRFRRGDWLHSILLPETTDARERRALLLAWPADEKTGTIYAVEPGGRLWSNDIALAAVGAESIDARDVFVDGAFGQNFQPGWELLHLEATTDELVGGNGSSKDSPENGESMRGELALLAQAEEAGKDGLPSLKGLLMSEHPKISARAAWLLGKSKHKAAIPELIELAGGHGDSLPRRHALAALKRMPDTRALTVAGICATDPDLEIRTQAAALLGRIQSKSAADDLLALLALETTTDQPRTDRVQALLALNDMDVQTALLPAATSIQNPDKATGEALTYYYQEQSPKLKRDTEVQILIAVLDHEVQTLRSFAIQRLAVLKAKSAVTALEARLATETDVLRPKVETALAAIRGQGTNSDQALDFWERIKTNSERLWGKGLAYWQSLPQQTRSIATAAASFVGVMLVMLTLLIARRRRRRRAEASAEWLEPSLGHAASTGEVLEEYPEDGYYEDAESWPEGAEDAVAQGQPAAWQSEPDPGIDFVETDDPGAWTEDHGPSSIR